MRFDLSHPIAFAHPPHLKNAMVTAMTSVLPTTSTLSRASQCVRSAPLTVHRDCTKRATSKDQRARTSKVVVRSSGHGASDNGAGNAQPKSEERFISVSDLLDEVNLDRNCLLATNICSSSRFVPCTHVCVPQCIFLITSLDHHLVTSR